MRLEVYLAGPDVFLPEPHRRLEAMRQICARHGLHALTPLDPLPSEVGEPGAATIARRNEAHIRRSSAILANLTPFRGPGADPGTAYEVGFGRALGRPVFGYATVEADYAARVRRLSGGSAGRDADGLQIEDFGLFENLMISCGIAAGGGCILTGEVVDTWGDLSMFERCAARAASMLQRGLSRTNTLWT